MRTTSPLPRQLERAETLTASQPVRLYPYARTPSSPILPPLRTRLYSPPNIPKANPSNPPGFDARFPNQNQTKHCWQNYVDYHKCINAKGEDFKPCRQVRANITSTLACAPEEPVFLT